MSKGGRNLIILGIASILVTAITCGISLFLYNTSGDIYLDRSRPGFLPEESEEAETKNDFSFSEDGDLNNDAIDEYLDNLKETRASIKGEEFGPDVLSDKNLGIPESEKSEE
ncbi:MAG: hypothetical protein Q4E47_02620 [Candidatus Saccharibacteria bacterium]|nr:hypothetical protein [Candidatus Saccharibacteria bacterium]